MTDKTTELVTKLDVQPDLAGVSAFEESIKRAREEVKKLDAAIKKTNELRPASRYAPPVNNPKATAVAAGLSTGLGSNLVSRTSLAPLVNNAAKEVAKNAAQTAATGVNLALEDMRGRLTSSGRGLIPHSGTNWSGGHAGGVARPEDFRPYQSTKNPFDLNNFSGDPIPGKPGQTEKQRRKGKGFEMPDLIGAAGTVAGLAIGFNKLSESLDRIQSQEAQLARLPQTIGSSKDAFLELTAAASQVRSKGDAFINTYMNMATATEKLGLSQAETIKASQGMVSALQLGGGSKVAIDNAMYQMGQAFSSDRFGGDEFRSFMEAIGTMAPTVAKAFGTDVKGLREMSEKGKLTAEVMTKAFAKMADNNIALLNKQGWTWAQVTTVMGNDWDTFVATATKNEEWAHLMDWIAKNVIPVFKDAETAVAKFWAGTADESKASILVGVLGTLGAAFAALAVPVLAATWPFLAVGAALFILYELFQEFKAWMNGTGLTIFDNLFGSFDEFEKRYPTIVRALRALMEATGGATDSVNDAGADVKGKDGHPDVVKELANPFSLFGNAFGFVAENLNPLPFIEDILSMPQQLSELPMLPPALTRGGNQTTITNSGNTTITVATPEEAARVANARDASFADNQFGSLANIAEAAGAV